MLNIFYNVLFIILGVYLIVCGSIGQGLVSNSTSTDEGSETPTATSGIPHKKLFISLIVVGIIIILASIFNIYRLLTIV
tara:strand:- start:12147 stop:12383 length:237 start_codon:yes stop_codon:yes gene_type:complete